MNLLDLLPPDITDTILLSFDTERDLNTYLNLSSTLQIRYDKDQICWESFCKQKDMFKDFWAIFETYYHRYQYYLHHDVVIIGGYNPTPARTSDILIGYQPLLRHNLTDESMTSNILIGYSIEHLSRLLKDAQC